VTFVSLAFPLFFVTAVGAYYALPHRWRWACLVLAGYGFYMSWRPVYGLLLLTTTLVSYTTARRMASSSDRRGRRRWLLVSLSVDLGLLIGFKYAGFLGDVVRSVGEGRLVDSGRGLLLPVGISFYTFQALSYSIDVYRGAREPERHLGFYAAYVSFFPLLVSGPIERSRHLLPQLRQPARWDAGRVRSGVLRMLWGFFQKLVIADRLGGYVDAVYLRPEQHHGLALLLASYLFIVQLYCDFAGYSDIAIGAARILGIDVMENFRRPFFATSIPEFWQRWHISLSTWFRDYVYVPLARRRRWKLHPAWDFFPLFVLIGLWHGANWTFVAFGAIHASYMAVSVLTARRRARLRRRLRQSAHPAAWAVAKVALVLHLLTASVVFFRAASIGQGLDILRRIATPTGSIELGPTTLGAYELLIGLIGFAVVLLVHAVQAARERGVDLCGLTADGRGRVVAYGYGLGFALLAFGYFGHSDFIYGRF
jgi:D-alanyl-lipoteichoic acid acyltransferase DltB (MBOAT superfamily)